MLSLVVLMLVATSWSGIADQHAHAETTTTFKKALAAAALARAFNGVISVAQGTEVAIQPVGVGVTLTVGEILDPLNDLVERFSVLALAASVSLGLQITLGDIFSSDWLNILLSLAAVIMLISLWLPATSTPAHLLLYTTRLLTAVIFVRFVLVAVLLVSHVLNMAFLSDQQTTAMQQLSAASTEIELLQQENTAAQSPVESDGFFDRTGAQLKQMLDASSQSMDLKAQLQNLQQRVENSVEDMIRLIVIFLLQTLILPLTTMWLCWRLFLSFWQWIRPKSGR